MTAYRQEEFVDESLNRSVDASAHRLLPGLELEFVHDTFAHAMQHLAD